MLIKQSERKVLNVGVLLPKSNQYPNAALNFLHGLKLYFTLNDNSFERGKAELIVENVGVGMESVSIEKAHKLLVQDEVVMLTGLLEPIVGVEVGKMTNLADKPTLFSGLGESAVVPSDVSENLFFNTLQLWQAYFMMGQYAAENLGDRPISVITSLYDCGYDPLKAFRLGLKSKGGVIHEEVILKSESLDELREEVGQNIVFNKNQLYTLIFHPRMLIQFIDIYGDEMQDLIITPFYEGKNKNQKYWAFPNWRNHDDLSRIFQNGVKEYLNAEADVFHLLGYQQGQLIYTALDNLSDPNSDDQNILESWKQFDENTLLGPSFFDNKDHFLKSQISIFSGIDSKNSFSTKATLEPHFDHKEGLEDLYGIRNSFTNPYMFF